MSILVKASLAAGDSVMPTHGVGHHGCIKGYPGIAALGEVKPSDATAKDRKGEPHGT
jgi:hypothetical protein